jgi:hypothetical protein
LRLPSTSLKGTFLQAYLLLNEICNKIGWDDLLKHRSVVFVMEEEYRIHRAIQEEEEKRGSVVGLEDEDERDLPPNAPPPIPSGDVEIDDTKDSANPVTDLNPPLSLDVSDSKGKDEISSPVESEADAKENSFSPLSSPLRDSPTVSPTRREEFDIVDLEDDAISPPKVEVISSPRVVGEVEEDDFFSTAKEAEAISPVNSPTKVVDLSEEEDADLLWKRKQSEASSVYTQSDKDEFSPVDLNNITIDSDATSPTESVKSDDTIGKSLSIDETLKRLSLDSDNSPLIKSDKGKGRLSVDQGPSSGGAGSGASNQSRQSISYNNFRRKRLCEKWLDNLFMVLYNDLRLFTALKQVGV